MLNSFNESHICEGPVRRYAVLRYNPEGCGLVPMVSLEIFIDIILPAASWSCGRLSL